MSPTPKRLLQDRLPRPLFLVLLFSLFSFLSLGSALLTSPSTHATSSSINVSITGSPVVTVTPNAEGKFASGEFAVGITTTHASGYTFSIKAAEGPNPTRLNGTTTEGFDAFNDGYGNKVEILNDDGRRVVYGHLREILVKKGERVTKDTIIGKTGCSGGSRVPHLHVEIRKENTDETGLEHTLDPLDVLPKLDLNSLKEEFVTEPYAHLWKIMNSENPWSFSKEDIKYSEDPNYIK